MNRAALHTLGPIFFASGGNDGPHRGQRREFFRIFPRLWAATTIAAGFVVKTASMTAEFASIPVRGPSARTLRTFMRPQRRRSRCVGGSKGRDLAGLFLFIGYEQPLLVP